MGGLDNSEHLLRQLFRAGLLVTSTGKQSRQRIYRHLWGRNERQTTDFFFFKKGFYCLQGLAPRAPPWGWFPPDFFSVLVFTLFTTMIAWKFLDNIMSQNMDCDSFSLSGYRVFWPFSPKMKYQKINARLV